MKSNLRKGHILRAISSIILAVFLYAVAFFASDALVHLITENLQQMAPSDNFMLEYWWIVLAGMSFGALAGAMYRMALWAKRSGKPGTLHQFYMGIAGGFTIDGLLIGGASMALFSMWQEAQRLLQAGVGTVGFGCAVPLGIVCGLIAGHVYAVIVTSD